MLTVLLACAGAPDDTAAPEVAPDTASPDTGPGTIADQTGLLAWVGEAVVGEAYAGTEQIRVAPTTGSSAPVCLIEVTVTSTAARSDCSDCIWAFDVVFGEPEIIESAECEAAGYTEAVIAGLAGTQRSYGFADEHLGHAEALLVLDAGAWQAVSFADWSPDTGLLSYAWEQGYLSY